MNKLHEMIREMMEQAAEGREVIDTPDDLAGSGPCPYCGWRIDPSPYTFAENVVGTPITAEEIGLSDEGGDKAGIIVCGSCAKPVVFDQPGKFLKLPREKLRQLPRITRRFVQSEIEAVLQRKRAIN